MQFIVTPYYLVCFSLFNDDKQWGGMFVHGLYGHVENSRKENS